MRTCACPAITLSGAANAIFEFVVVAFAVAVAVPVAVWRPTFLQIIIPFLSKPKRVSLSLSLSSSRIC